MNRGKSLRNSPIPFGTRWEVLYCSELDGQDDRVRIGYAEVGATSVKLQVGMRTFVIPFDQIDISEAAGVILAQRNERVVLHLRRAE